MSMDEPLTKLPHFDWDKAKAFYYVVKVGNQIEAAKFLGCSQPNLSRQITVLEDELNCRLLVRTRRGTTLTRKGMQFFKIIEETFSKLKGFTYNNAVIGEDGERRIIKIAATHPVAAYVLSEHLISYKKMHPHICFEVITNDQMIDLFVMDIDMAIRPFVPEAKGIQQEHLFTFEKRLFASQSYIDKYGQPQTIEDMRNHHMLVQAEPEKHPYSDTQWILKLGMEPGGIHEPVFKSNSLECLIDAAKEGLGIISCYEEMSIVKAANLKKILPDVKGPPIEDFISYPDYLAEDKEIINFKNYLLGAFA